MIGGSCVGGDGRWGLDLSGAIYGDHGAGNVAGEIGGEEEEDVGDFLGFTDAAEGDAGGDSVNHLLGEGGEHIGAGDAGGDGVDADVVGAEFAGEGFGEAVDGEFGGGIAAAGGLAVKADHRASVQDDAAALSFHEGCGGFGAGKNGFKIEVDDGVEGGFVVVIEGFAGGDAGVVDQDVKVAVVVNEVLEGGGHGLDAGELGSDAGDGAARVGGLELLNGFFGTGRFRATDDDAGALFQKGFGDGVADAAGAAGDDGDFVFQ